MLEKLLAKDLADVDGRGGEKNAAAAALVPVDVTFSSLSSRNASSRRDSAARLASAIISSGLGVMRREFRLNALERRGQIRIRLVVAIEE